MTYKMFITGIIICNTLLYLITMIYINFINLIKNNKYYYSLMLGIRKI